MTTSTLTTALRAAGYEPRRPEILALAGALTAPRGAGARCLLVEGPPGAGKSALAEAVATALGVPLVVHQCHAWTDADELFVGVDVAAAVAGDAENVREDGVLAVAARLSQAEPPAGAGASLVLLLDELDKAPERAEALLLDWLQSGRVPVRPGVHLQTRLDRVLVVITSNGVRPLGEALIRRCRRVRMDPLPTAIQERILVERSGLPARLVQAAWRAAREVAALDGCACLSLQEGVRLLAELACCESAEDCGWALAGWAGRGERAQERAPKFPQAPGVWGEVLRYRRTSGSGA
jgi:MoxR-like ATPase